MKTLIIAAALFFMAPALSFAATYAFVNTNGEVMSMEASSSTEALNTAPNLHVHSGVMLVGSDDSGIIGDDVSGT